ncbi:hydrogenase maturation protease [Romboutsia sp.]|uniref:hydrogenase maturation protease n=1 Tax=Romboutsia sp. TaxID=1965302 RepID=UPI002B7A0113|nr:hydrogenase maturation protease [Romboutsia sp.]HSQ88857.1 hydrogenase maturation protease [Romboutsia sp.]
MIKVFAIGNILLCDDGVGVKVVDKIKDEIKSLSEDIEVIIGETDFMYCLINIEKEDFVIIIDSTYLGIEPGSITVFDFKECDKFVGDLSTQHEESLLKILRMNYREVKGCLIGIEVDVVDYSLKLSNCLSERFNCICNEVFNQIKDRLKEKKLGE